MHYTAPHEKGFIEGAGVAAAAREVEAMRFAFLPLSLCVDERRRLTAGHAQSVLSGMNHCQIATEMPPYPDNNFTPMTSQKPKLW